MFDGVLDNERIIVIVYNNSLISNKENTTTLTKVTFFTSSAGVAASLMSIVLLLITAFAFVEWRRSFKNQLLIQLVLARFLYTFMRYYHDIRVLFHLCDRYNCIKQVDWFFLIHTEIFMVCWMFVFTKHMHTSLVKVFFDKRNIYKVTFLTLLVSYIIAGAVYFMMFGFGGRSINLKTYLIYLLLFKWPILIWNAVMLVQILLNVLKSNNAKSKVNRRGNIRTIIVMRMLLFVLCFHQIFLDIFNICSVFFDLSSLVMVICNTTTLYQSASTTFFWIFGNDRTRQLWKNWLNGMCCCCDSNSTLVPLPPAEGTEIEKQYNENTDL